MKKFQGLTAAEREAANKAYAERQAQEEAERAAAKLTHSQAAAEYMIWAQDAERKSAEYAANGFADDAAEYAEIAQIYKTKANDEEDKASAIAKRAADAAAEYATFADGERSRRNDAVSRRDFAAAQDAANEAKRHAEKAQAAAADAAAAALGFADNTLVAQFAREAAYSVNVAKHHAERAAYASQPDDTERRAAEEAERAKFVSAEAAAAHYAYVAEIAAHFERPAETDALKDFASFATVIDCPRIQSLDKLITAAYAEAQATHKSAINLEALARINPGLHSDNAAAAREHSKTAAYMALGMLIWGYMGHSETVATLRQNCKKYHLAALELERSALEAQRAHVAELATRADAMIATPYPHNLTHAQAAKEAALAATLHAYNAKQRARRYALRVAEHMIALQTNRATLALEEVEAAADAAADAANEAETAALIVLINFGYTRATAAAHLQAATREAQDHARYARLALAQAKKFWKSANIAV